MTQSDHRKVLKQIGSKPGKLAKWKKHNVPKERKFGTKVRACRISGQTRGVIHNYSLNMSRQLFREHAKELGFKQYN